MVRRLRTRRAPAGCHRGLRTLRPRHGRRPHRGARACPRPTRCGQGEKTMRTAVVLLFVVAVFAHPETNPRSQNRDLHPANINPFAGTPDLGHPVASISRATLRIGMWTLWHDREIQMTPGPATKIQTCES